MTTEPRPHPAIDTLSAASATLRDSISRGWNEPGGSQLPARELWAVVGAADSAAVAISDLGEALSWSMKKRGFRVLAFSRTLEIQQITTTGYRPIGAVIRTDTGWSVRPLDPSADLIAFESMEEALDHVTTAPEAQAGAPGGERALEITA